MGVTKAEQAEALRRVGLDVDPKDYTQAELQEMIDARAVVRVGDIVLYELTEDDARTHNRACDGLSRFLKASRGGPLPSVRVRAGEVVPVIVNAFTGEGALCGNAQIPGGGVLWLEGFEPFEEG